MHAVAVLTLKAQCQSPVREATPAPMMNPRPLKTQTLLKILKITTVSWLSQLVCIPTGGCVFACVKGWLISPEL